jgi:SAM-dependent methyltransferase
MITELKNRIAVLVGASLLAAVGRDRFYQLAQDRRGVAGRIASAFCQGHAGRVGANYAIWNADKDKRRITDAALAHYSDDSMHGFGDADYAQRADGKPLLEQQRGLIIPLVKRAIRDSGAKRVLEIGTGNGDVLAHLAAEFPDVEFIGVDLSVANAENKHRGSNANVSFVKGYALDLLSNNEIKADVVFGSSTFCIFAPKELEAYLACFTTAGVKRLVISDPVVFGNVHEKDTVPKSRHMDSYMWWHNYWGYLTAWGWTVDGLETARFAYTHNPNAQVVLFSAMRTT